MAETANQVEIENSHIRLQRLGNATITSVF